MKQSIKCGIYFITNTINNHTYVGSSKNIKLRWYSHRHGLKYNKHPNRHLQNAWKKYGAAAFKFEIVEEIQENHLDTVERQYLDLVAKLPFWYYNIGLDPRSAMRGRRHTEETKRKISQIKKGKKPSEEARLNMSLGQMGNTNCLGFKHSEEFKKRISEAKKGAKMPLAQGQKTSIRMQGNQLAVGYKHTDEFKKWAAKNLKGNKRALGHKHTQETRDKMSKTRQASNYKHSEETRKKLSAAIKAAHSRRSFGFQKQLKAVGFTGFQLPQVN